MAAVNKEENLNGVKYTYTIDTDRKTGKDAKLPAVLRFDYKLHDKGVEIEVVEHFMKLEGIQGKILSAVVQANDGKIIGDNGKVMIRSIDAWMRDTSGGTSKVDVEALKLELLNVQKQYDAKKTEIASETDQDMKNIYKDEFKALSKNLTLLKDKLAEIVSGGNSKADAKTEGTNGKVGGGWKSQTDDADTNGNNNSPF